MRAHPQLELSVGEVAKRAGIAVSAVRFYEEKGLIQSERSAGNQRRYSRDVLRRIAVIRTAQRVGIPLARIAESLAELPGNGAPTQSDWARLSSAWKANLDDRIAELTRLRDALDGCVGCGCLSTEVCALYNKNDRAAALGPGALMLR